MGQNKKSAKIYTASSQGKLNVSFNDTKQIINVTNNKAKSYEELAAKYRDEAKKYRDEAQEFAEQNSNVTMKDIYQVQNLLESKINTKQPIGDYALVSQIPENISDLNNDSQYATVTQLANLLPPQSASGGKFLKTDGEFLEWANISAFSLFDTKLSDHILEGDEGFGWALQGTYTLSSYTDFYQKCLAEKNAGVATQTALGESTITTYNNANGHIFYDIADKAVVDAFYNANGACWMYGIDTENQRIFLPRNKWVGIKGTTDTIPVKGNGKALGMTDGNVNFGTRAYGSVAAIYGYKSSYGAAIGTTSSTSGGIKDGVSIGVTTNAANSGLIADTTDIIQIDTNKLLYICVGNTMVNESEVNAAKLTTDVQNLEANKADIVNVPALAAPSSRHETLTIGASGTTYIAPAAGYFTMNATKPNDGQVILQCKPKCVGSSRWVNANGSFVISSSLVQAGDVVLLAYDGSIETTITGTGFWFVYAEGAKEVE